MTVTILLAFYIVPFIGMYCYTRIVYSPIGMESELEPNALDLFLTVCPLINLAACVASWGFYPPYDDGKRPAEVKKSRFIRKFYNLPG